MKVILALVFGALAQGQTTTQGHVSSLVAPLPQKQATPAASSSVLAKSATPVPITPPRASNNATALKDRQFFVANPVMDAMLVSTLAPKSTSSTSASTTSSSSSSSGLASTLLVASMLNSGNQQQQQQRSRYSQPQYSQPQYSQPQYSQPQYSQPQYSQPQYGQPQYFAPPQRSYQSMDGYGYDSHYGAQQEDPLKKMVLLSGVVSGSVNPLAAVAMDNNKQMSSTDALVMSSLGNNPLSTMLAVSGGGGGSGSLFGSGSGSSNNMLTTLAVASAFAPKSSTSSGSSALGTLATLSLLNQNQNNGGGGSSSNGGGLFAGLFGN